uniref:MKNK2 n=1 Tax=Gongylonema pulchrum TaxID=637853 RepID=A0A183DEH9_9BILA
LDQSLSVTGEESAKSLKTSTHDKKSEDNFGSTALRQLELLAAMKSKKKPKPVEKKPSGTHFGFDLRAGEAHFACSKESLWKIP